MGTRRFLSIFSLLGLVMAGTQLSAAPQHFGARLTATTQPSNAGHGIFCNGAANNNGMCTWVLMQAFQCEFGSCLNGHLAPANGTIGTIKVIACFPGSFVLQIAKNVNPKTNQAEVVRSGPLIDYQGDPQHCNGQDFAIESFTVSVPVLKGEYLAVATDRMGFIRCSGGGDNSIDFEPPLADGGALRKATHTDGCFMLLEAIYQ